MRFHNTRIYQRAIELQHLCRSIQDDLPTGYGFLADQLRRASMSIALNFAEGCGKASRADQRRFFTMARGSAYEVAAILDVGRCYGVVTDERRAKGPRGSTGAILWRRC